MGCIYFETPYKLRKKILDKNINEIYMDSFQRPVMIVGVNKITKRLTLKIKRGIFLFHHLRRNRIDN